MKKFLFLLILPFCLFSHDRIDEIERRLNIIEDSIQEMNNELYVQFTKIDELQKVIDNLIIILEIEEEQKKSHK